LIEEWQPEPLVPDVDENHPVLQNIEKRLVQGWAPAVLYVSVIVQ